MQSRLKNFLSIVLIFCAGCSTHLFPRQTDWPGDFASKEEWFERTKNHHYPDTLYRLWDAFFRLVENRAAILVSTKEDYEFGDNWTRLGAKIRGGLLGTHGALAKDSSSAFLMADIEGVSLPEAIRYDEAMLFLKGGE